MLAILRSSLSPSPLTRHRSTAISASESTSPAAPQPDGADPQPAGVGPQLTELQVLPQAPPQPAPNMPLPFQLKPVPDTQLGAGLVRSDGAAGYGGSSGNMY